MMDQSQPVFASAWKRKPLLLMHLIAALLLASLMFPAGQTLWCALDTQVFYSLNGSLAESGNWAWFWAWANTRYKDLLLALVMLVFLVFPGLGFKRDQLQQALVGFLALMLVLLLFRELVQETAKLVGLTGPSPSLVLQPAYLLTDMFPNIPTKDSAGRSFPGDHATVMIIWAGYLLYNARQWSSYLAVILAVVSVLPRLIGGAHWLTDVLVGGFAIALPVLAWACYSPLLLQFTRWLEKGFLPLFRLFSHLPLLGRLPFFAINRRA